MRHTTHVFAVQIDHEGRLSVHSWAAKYAPNGRQLPAARLTEHDVSEEELAYDVAEFLDATLRARERVRDLTRDPLPNL